MNTRVAHFSDLHYCEKHLDEVQRCFEWAVSHAIDAGVDVAVVSGDATDHELGLHAPSVEALARAIRRLADHCPVLMLQGTYTHEPPGTLNVFRFLGGKHAVYVADKIEQVALAEDGTWRGSKDWCFKEVPALTRVLFSCLPTVNKADVAAVRGAVNAAEGVGEAIDVLLKGWGPANRKARAAGIATVAVSHGTVNGCVTEHGVPMAGLDHEFSLSGLFAAEASAFMLGHIHKHQVWSDGSRQVAYAGSIGRLHYGEEGDKGFLLWDVGAEGSTLRHIVTPAKRLVDIEFNGAPDIDRIREAAREAAGAFVRVRWTITEEERNGVDSEAIKRALAGAAEVKLEGRVLPIVRSRAQGIGQANSLEEKVQRWAAHTGVEASGVLGRLAMLASGDAEEVIHAVVTGCERRAETDAMASVLGMAEQGCLQGQPGEFSEREGRQSRALVEECATDLFGQ